LGTTRPCGGFGLPSCEHSRQVVFLKRRSGLSEPDLAVPGLWKGSWVPETTDRALMEYLWGCGC
jgi:hypothetical protein